MAKIKVVKVTVTKGVVHINELDDSIEVHVTDFDDSEQRIYREIEGDITLVKVRPII